MSVKINTTESFIIDKLKKYIGFSVIDLKKILGIVSNSKSVNSLVIKNICIKENLTEIIKSNQTIIKTVSIENNRAAESMSFPAFRFKDIVLESWESSFLRSYLTKGIIMCFFTLENNLFILSSIKYWQPSEGDLIEAERIWRITKNTIINGEIVKSLSNYRETNFPKIKDSFFLHVRPHGRDINDTFELPTTDKLTGNNFFTKQSFWINSSFIDYIFAKY